ncbi:hypothetical protein ACEPPN_003105 [Leptodophora sp. 'Broadleaf-Isolate-01']
MSLNPTVMDYPDHPFPNQTTILFPDASATVSQVREWLRFWFRSKTLQVPTVAISSVPWNGRDLYDMSDPGDYIDDLVS